MFPTLVQAFRSSIVRGSPPVPDKQVLLGRTGWQPYECGASIGSVGSEGGVIILDDENPADARITLRATNKTPRAG
jgi:hypothetical protein